MSGSYFTPGSVGFQKEMTQWNVFYNFQIVFGLQWTKKYDLDVMLNDRIDKTWLIGKLSNDSNLSNIMIFI